jgi:hypothetical protein
MDDNRFDQLTKSLSSGLSRRSLLRSLAAAVGLAVIGSDQASAAPGGSKGGNGDKKCYGAGSQCTNAKQCCSGTCTNRVCAPEGPGDPCATLSCDDGNPCTTDTCSAGQCVHSLVTVGTPIANQTPGDCQIQVCDGQGNIYWQADDSDLPPASTNPCVVNTCIMGNVSGELVAQGTPCGDGLVCDGGGTCAPPVSGPCAGKPKGTPLPPDFQTSGDCQLAVCDGIGGISSIPDDTDAPNYGKPCVIDMCSDGQYTYTTLPAGTPCGINLVCDMNGGCVLS